MPNLKQIRHAIYKIIDDYPKGYANKDERKETIENLYCFIRGRKDMLYDAIKSSTNLSSSFIAKDIFLFIQENYGEAEFKNKVLSYKVKACAVSDW